MKTAKNNLVILRNALYCLLIIVFSGFTTLRAQEDCTLEKFHGQGFSTAITSVEEVDDSRYNVVLTVKHDGCAGKCKAMAHYSIEALPDTYSDVVITVITGSFNYQNINRGPDLGNDPFTGFRINGTAGFGNGTPGEFTVAYTLTGGLQDQQALVKAGNKLLIVSFTAEDFQSVLECGSPNIFPYYQPPEGGKLVNSLIGPELTSLHEVFINGFPVVTDNIFQIDGDNVLIRVFANSGQYNDLLTLLSSPDYGLEDSNGIPGLLSISGWFPIANLLLLNDLPLLINYARPEYTPQSNSGIVTSQGDTSIRSNIARSAFNLSGEGVKIGVLSDSYNKKIGNPANDDILKGDLPGIGFNPDGDSVPNPVNSTNVEVLKDYPFSASDEGRAMLQIIHDIAPKSDLAFRTGFLNPVDFAQGILELRDAGCDVIVDDITYISEPFFNDGVVSAAVNQVKTSGVSFVTAAGNYGDKSYQSTFSGTTPPPGIIGEAHNFAAGSGNDIYQSVSVPEGNYTLVLQWDDGSQPGASSTDMDIYLSKDDGSTLFGFNRVNTGGDPVEVLPFSVGPGGAQTNILIVKASGLENVELKYIVFRGELAMNEYGNAAGSTIIGHANAEGAMTVGAVLYSNTPEYGINPPTIASFSSQGGMITEGSNRMKPDFSGPNGVNTTVDFGSVNYEGDPFPNFFGTSAAAPHIAGVAALLIEATNKFYDTGLNPDALKQILQTTAIDMGNPGYDVISGYGFVQADAALLSLANPSPVISGLIYDTTLVPGQDSIPVTLLGNYLTSESEIYFNGQPLLSGTENLGDTAISGIIYPFPDLYPEIQAYNPPKSGTNGTDGGLSNPAYFSEKESILIDIGDKSKKYGEILPEFSALNYQLVSVDGSISLDSSNLTQAEKDRIYSVPFVAPNVSALSNAGLWAITASPDDPLNPVSEIPPTDTLDISLLNRYNFVFRNGLLTINKLDLLIRPQDTTFTYGDTIAGFPYEYIFNDDPDSNIVIEPQVNEQILSTLRQGHATALVNAKATALVNAQATALVNFSCLISATALVNTNGLIDIELDDPETLFDSTALSNGAATALVNGASSTILRATALVNGQATALVNGQATALVNARSLVHATALVNTITINGNSNSDALIILGEEDINILAGESQGDITLVAMNLLPTDDAGEHWIIPGTYLSANFNVSYETGTYTILPAEADVIFEENTLSKTYDGLPAQVVLSTDPEELNVDIDYQGMPGAPKDAGSYTVNATVNETNFTGTSSAVLNIYPSSVGVTIDDAQKAYGQPDPSFSWQITSGELFGDDSITGFVEREAGEDSGIYSIVGPTLATESNYILEVVPGTFNIEKAQLIISVSTDYIFEGDPLPELTYGFNTFVNGDDESVLSGLTYVLSPNFNGNPGTYEAIPQASAINYEIVPESGFLYVNPSGPGTKHIIPKLSCVEQLPQGEEFDYMAHFYYENKNNSDVFIPKGEDNLMASQGLFDDTGQPELFISGGGSFTIPFDGTDLTWVVASYNHKGQKTSQGQTANAGSNSCFKTAGFDGNDQNISAFDKVYAYPNPTTGTVYLTLNDDLMASGQIHIRVLNNYGRVVYSESKATGSNLLEINLSGMNDGLFLIMLKGKSSQYTLHMIKN